MAKPPHGPLFRDHPWNVWAWERMRETAREMRAAAPPGAPISQDALARAIALRAWEEHGVRLREHCVTQDILMRIAEDAARFPYDHHPPKKKKPKGAGSTGAAGNLPPQPATAAPEA